MVYEGINEGINSISAVTNGTLKNNSNVSLRPPRLRKICRQNNFAYQGSYDLELIAK